MSDAVVADATCKASVLVLMPLEGDTDHFVLYKQIQISSTPNDLVDVRCSHSSASTARLDHVPKGA